MTYAPPIDALLSSTTYRLIRPVEAAAFLLQSGNIAYSLVNDSFVGFGQQVMAGLLMLHLGIALFCFKYPGPLTRGGVWPAVWAIAGLVMPLIAAHVYSSTDFSSGSYGIKLQNYTFIILAIFAFHPWWLRFPNLRFGWLVEGLVVFVVAVEPLLIIAHINRWQLGEQFAYTVIIQVMWTLIWYTVGKGVNRLCRRAVQVQSEALTTSYREALDGLHTLADIAYMRIVSGHSAREAAEELKVAIYERRRSLLAFDESASVATILRNSVRLYASSLEAKYKSPGPLSMHRDMALVFERCLTDLLKNVVWHGGGIVDISLEVDDNSQAHLRLSDHGPGFDASVFDDPSTNLAYLRRSAREVGGDLLKLPSPSGAVLELSIPLNPQR